MIILDLAFQLVHFYGRADTCVLYKSGKLSETKSYEKAETRGARKLHLGTKDGSAQTNKQKPIFTSNCSEDDLTFEAFGGFIQVLLHASSAAAVAAATAEETSGAVVEAPARRAKAATRGVVAAQRGHR